MAPNSFGIIVEDGVNIVSTSFLTDALREISLQGYDLVSLYKNQLEKKSFMGEDTKNPDNELILDSDCLHDSSAYVLSKRAAVLLAGYGGPVIGGLLDHMCYLVRQHGLRAGYVSGAAGVERRVDFNLHIHPGWVVTDLPAFHCVPPPPDPARPATVEVASCPEYNEFPPAPVLNASARLYRVYVNLEGYQPRGEPWAAQADAVFSFRPIPGRVPSHPLSYALGRERQYRRAGLPWAARSDRLYYWVSHCVPARLALLAEMNRHLPAPAVSLGACAAEGSPREEGFPGCPRARDVLLGYNPEKRCALGRVRLALALENSAAAGYMTEKLWLPLLAGAVPVYHGAPDVAAWLPAPEAAIDVAAFPSVAAAVEYAVRVAGNETLWAHHTAWRRRPFGVRFLHLLRTALPDFLCGLDPAVL